MHVVCPHQINQDTKDVVQLTCSHVYHRQCIVRWWLSALAHTQQPRGRVDLQCPVCRKVISSSQKEQPEPEPEPDREPDVVHHSFNAAVFLPPLMIAMQPQTVQTIHSMV